MKMSETDVLIVGAGPVGLLLAHLLGQGGVRALVLERDEALSDEPRAVGLDPESLRTFQGLGLLRVLEKDLMHGLTGEYYNGDGELLFAIDDDSRGPLGYTQLAGFNQPALVRTLATELARYPDVALKYRHTLTAFTTTADGIEAEIATPAGTEGIAARYLVGCDGGRSTVRQQLGISMTGVSNPQPWLVIDTVEQEYDGLRKYRFFCDPRRPGMFVQTPHNNRRWEWMLLPGDNREDFLRDETIEALLSPHIDVSKVDIYRRRVYDFHAIIAERFQAGRVFLAGDAAHMTPPFAGQGLNSGIRDAANLGWKLCAVLRRGVPGTLLDSYGQERWQHARELIDVAVTLGNQIQPIDPDAAADRDAFFAELNRDKNAMDDFVGGIFKALLDRYFLEGCAIGIGEQYLAGRMISQPEVTDERGRVRLLDECTGAGFTLLGYNADPRELIPQGALAPWLDWGASVIHLRDDGAPADLHMAPGSHLAELFGSGEADMVLLRPDHFCLAAFDAASAAGTLGQAAGLLGIPVASGRGL